MYFKLKCVGLLMALFVVSGCAGVGRQPVDERRQEIDTMAQTTLEQLYMVNSSAKEMIDRAAGYAVFSNITGQFIFLGGGGGYGVVVTNESGQRVYMKMAQVGVGLGLGIQDVRVIFVFHSNLALDRFIYHGWDFGGQADAVAASDGKGGGLGGGLSVYPGVDVYTLSKAGLLVKVNLAGTKYWKDEKLNY